MSIDVRDLSPETSLSDLLGRFEVFGKVTNLTISTYKLDGKYRGLGFIEMPSNDRGQAAVAGLHRKELGGNQMRDQKKTGEDPQTEESFSGADCPRELAPCRIFFKRDARYAAVPDIRNERCRSCQSLLGSVSV